MKEKSTCTHFCYLTMREKPKEKRKKNDHDVESFFVSFSYDFSTKLFVVLDLKMLRNIFLISLTLILFNGKNIFGSDNPPLDSIDVQAVLEKKVPDCKIRNFFIEKKDFQKFAEDIKAFCSTPNKNPLICHMIAYEIEKACQLPNEPDQRPTPAHYDLQIKSSEVCGKNRVLMTSKWILNKLSTNLQTKIPIEPKDLCTQVTTDQDTIRITRFFYHIAARVRSADSTDKNNKG